MGRGEGGSSLQKQTDFLPVALRRRKIPLVFFGGAKQQAEICLFSQARGEGARGEGARGEGARGEGVRGASGKGERVRGEVVGMIGLIAYLNKTKVICFCKTIINNCVNPKLAQQG